MKIDNALAFWLAAFLLAGSVSAEPESAPEGLALSPLGIQIGPMLAGLGIVGFIVSFALQDTLSNFAAGMMILVYRPSRSATST